MKSIIITFRFFREGKINLFFRITGIGEPEFDILGICITVEDRCLKQFLLFLGKSVLFDLEADQIRQTDSALKSDLFRQLP